MALWRRCPPSGAIHHSDRGSQYAALSFGERPEEAGVFDYIEGFYNPTRRRSSIGYMGPAGYERAIVKEVRTA